MKSDEESRQLYEKIYGILRFAQNDIVFHAVEQFFCVVI